MKRTIIDASFLLAVVISFGIGASCTNEADSQRALEDMGMTNIEFTGHDMFTCSKSDDTCTGFTAINPQGRHVKGAVGCGHQWACTKGCTVRFK